jgi:hypothetical protein
MSARTSDASDSSDRHTQLVPLAIPATAERVLRGLSPQMFAAWDAHDMQTASGGIQ